MMLDCWRSSWEHLIEFKMSIRALESDPLMVQVVPGSDMVILVGYEMHVGEAVGQMNMCIPVVFLNPVLDQITRQSQFIRKRSARLAEQTRQTIMRTLFKALVPVDAVLGTARMDVDDVANLAVDDIIQLDWDATEPIKVEVGTIERFRAHPGRSGGQSAIQLASIMREE
jgi:flagellar motor switch protein FliM